MTRSAHRCRGFASYNGHCGALDCDTCHPGGAREMDRQERLEEHVRDRELIAKQIVEINAEIDLLLPDLATNGPRIEVLDKKRDSLEDLDHDLSLKIEAIEKGEDDDDDFDAPDDDYDHGDYDHGDYDFSPYTGGF